MYVAQLVHIYVCQEIFTVKQPKNVKILGFPEGDRSSHTKPTHTCAKLECRT